MRRAGDTQALALQGGHDHYGCVMHIETTPEDHRIAWLAALAITIHVIESVLPSPLPGLKPGLANVVTIAVLL